MLMAELESLGAASASDEALPKRLGWTRSRSVQVLRELEDAKLVTSSLVKGESGRPRKGLSTGRAGPQAHTPQEAARERKTVLNVAKR